MFFLQFFVQQEPIPKHTPAPPAVIIENISQYLNMPMSATNRALAIVLGIFVIALVFFIMIKAIIGIWRDK